jgi:hypothetical protein
MKPHDLGDLMREYGRHLETQMTPVDLDQASVYQAKPRPRADTHRWMAVISVAAVSVVILAVAALYLASSSVEDEVADTAPTPTTLAPDVESMTDLEVIEAGVAAFYSGDGERAAELFELPDRTDDEIRGEAAYQAAIGGRLTLNCTENVPGTFSCWVPYHNAMTDAISYNDSGDTNDVVVEDGVITAFGFPEHSFIVVQMGTFLTMEGRFDGYESCLFGPFPESCATIQLENMDSWMEWRQTLEPANIVELALGSWYGGDCEEARFIASLETDVCSTSDTINQTIEYESILGANVSLGDCQQGSFIDDAVNLSCEVDYSNVMNTAVGKPSSATVREFNVQPQVGLMYFPDHRPWYLVDYPEDTELRESFTLFAEGAALADEYADAGCASARTPECANLILDNLDDWAVWYQTNS